MARKIPTKPGFYWAKTNEECNFWNTIVLIEGDTPFLSYKAWKFPTGEVTSGTKPDTFVFGSKIREPKDDTKSE